MQRVRSDMNKITINHLLNLFCGLPIRVWVSSKFCVTTFFTSPEEVTQKTWIPPNWSDKSQRKTIISGIPVKCR